MKKIILIILIFTNLTIFCQDTVRISIEKDTIRMTLEEVMELAEVQSLEAFRAQNMYLVGYWNYRSYKASLLPNVNLDIEPVSYVRAITKRYDFEQNIDVYRQQQSLENSAGLSVKQNLPFTGGTFFIRSSLNRIYNITDPVFVSYNAVPIQLGFYQPLFAYNDFKWQKKLAPLEFEIAKKQFIQNLETVKLTVLDLYFNLLLQYKRMSIAEENLKNTEKLYEIGKEKYKLLAIKKEDLLNLELQKYNAQIDVKREKQSLQQASLTLTTYLNLEVNNTVILPVAPKMNDSIVINYGQAVNYLENNPDILQDQQKLIEADASIEKAIRESRFQGNLIVNLGLNQQGEKLQTAYQNPLDQEIVSVSFQIPIIDWGKGKGQRQMAKMNREITEIDTKQNKIKLQQQLMTNILSFNLQKDIVKSAKKARQIANESYKLTENSFIYGQTSVTDLNAAKTSRQQAEEKYIESLYSYWKFYYTIEQMTLYDFIKNQEIKADNFFENINNQ